MQIDKAEPKILPVQGVRSQKATDVWPRLMLATVLFGCFLITTLVVAVIWMGFFEGLPGDDDREFTLSRYNEIFFDPDTYKLFWTTIQFSIVSIMVACGFGVPAAWIAERTDLPGKTILFTFMTIGLLIPGFSVAMGWLFMLHFRIGVINTWLIDWFNLAEAPFDIATIFGMGWVEGLNLTPLTFVMTAAVLRAMDPSLEEAAYTNGANTRKTLVQVTLPLVWPGILAAILYTFIIGFAAFDIPAIIGWSNRIYTFSTQLYLYVNPSEDMPKYGLAAALSAVMIPIAILISWWYRTIQKNAARYQVITGKSYRPRLVKLKSSVWIAWGFLALYLILGQLIPVLALVWSSFLTFFQAPSVAAFNSMSFDNYRLLPWDIVAEGAKNTTILVLFTPTITVLVSVAFSWMVLRSKFKWRGLFDFFAFLPHAVPNIIFGIGAMLLVLFVLQKYFPIYGTIWIVLIVLVLVRISYGTRVLNGALIQVHPELEEAAYMSGGNTGSVMRSVLFPILTPAMLYAWIWIALLSYRELALPAILAGKHNTTVALVVWDLWESGGLGKSAAMTVIILLCFTPLLMLYWYIARKVNVADK
ncbi:iron ABC transporter permease [Alphaproteobacteria bacterium]|nr:iron ABC transporter permease [Alphaproteobacteria bacterium]